MSKIAIDMPNDKAARKVLSLFKKIVKAKHSRGKVESWIATKPYVNGREVGYSLIMFSNDYNFHQRQVSFSEHRKSDNVVVYYGDSKEFEANTNIISEAAYETSTRYFKYNEQQAAAQFIYDFLVLGTIR